MDFAKWHHLNAPIGVEPKERDRPTTCPFCIREELVPVVPGSEARTCLGCGRMFPGRVIP